MIDLRESRLLKDIPQEIVQQFSRLSTRKCYPPGSIIFKAGDNGDGLYIILDGFIDISAQITQGQQKVLSRLGPGDFFGEMAILDNEPRSATAIAGTLSELVFIEREVVLSALQSSPKFALNLVREFSFRLRDFNRRYLEEAIQAERLAVIGRFARSIVHDFKNPLAIISFASDMAAAPDATPETRNSSYQRIRRQVDRLGNMINELLEFTRGQQSDKVLSPTNYAQFIQGLVDELQPEFAEKSVELILENQPPSVSVLLDPIRLTHAFHNLFHNSIDVMPGGGRIILRFSAEKKELHTEIEDTGPGIAPEILPKLFEPFATFGKAHGTGLGLSICKRIIEDHRGTIYPKTVQGRGAIFHITLPLFT
jgi:signal transduction histidine kinase